MELQVSILLSDGMHLAAELIDELVDVCERVEIGGSIRRRKPEVKDIELVLIPKWGERVISGQSSFLGMNTERVNLACDRLVNVEGDGRVQVIKPGTPEIVPWHLNPDGRYWRLWLPEPRVKIDVFVCDAETWGLNLMIRTGSGVGPDGRPESGFAPAMLARWKALTGGHSAGAQLRDSSGGIVRTPEERDVFEACRVRWVEPERRIAARDVEPAS